jgi:hypothetical protein
VIFEDHPPNLVRVCSRILQNLGELEIPKDTKSNRVVRPPLLDCNMAVGFLMGHHKTWGINVV